LFHALTAIGMVLYVTLGRQSVNAFYVSCGIIGFGIGYWAVFVTMASELFGTNLRATATTTAPNVVRAAIIPINAVYLAIKPSMGPVSGALAIGATVLVIAFVSLLSLEETHGRSLDFLES
jgi:hypothetical protein